MKKVKLDLSGLNGNAYSLMSAFNKAAKQQGFDQTYIGPVLIKCKQGDYDHLLQTLMEHTE